MNIELKKRILSLVWASVGMGIAFGLDYVATNIGMFNLSVELTAFIGLVIAQITKSIRNYVVANYTLP
jgi:hypothetical protein